LASGSGSAVALWLMLVEGSHTRPTKPTTLGRGLQVVTLGSMLIAFSTYQGEFDFRVPLFSVVELPVLLSAAAALALVPARLALGRGGALATAVTFIVLRGTAALLVGGLGHTVPRMPLYLASALVVEVVAWKVGTHARLRFAIVAGAAIATAGLAGEWAWESWVNGHHLPLATWPAAALLALAAGVGAGVLGGWLAGVVGDGSARPIGRGAVAVAGLALVASVAVPLPRHVGQVSAIVTLDRLSGPTLVTVKLRPPAAARRASVFRVMAVQGGGTVRAEVRQIQPGLYRTTRPVPVGGDWKTFVALYRGDEVMAAPISLPADPQIGASAVPAAIQREVAFTSIVAVLLREAHDGPVWTAVASYVALGAVFVVWLLFLGRAIRALHHQEEKGHSGVSPR
ncbi:MAG: hypothetical protein ABR540_10175, partial [Acidimicrobiales bacterium]